MRSLFLLALCVMLKSCDLILCHARPYRKRLKSFQEFRDYLFKVQSTRSVKGTRHYAYHDSVKEELFNPTDNSAEISADCAQIAVRAASRLREEMTSQKTGKNTWRYMSCKNGPESFQNITQAQKAAGIGKEATTTKAESTFSHLTYAMENTGTISEFHAAGLAQS